MEEYTVKNADHPSFPVANEGKLLNPHIKRLDTQPVNPETGTYINGRCRQ